MMLAIGADISGFELKEGVRAYLDELKIEYKDYGTLNAENPVEYYDIAPSVAKLIQSGEADRGILFCGTGMGMAQIANSFKGVRAAVCEGLYSAMLCRTINDSNILSMGGFLVAPNTAVKMTEAFLNTNITEGLESFHDFLLDAQLKIKELEESIY